MLLLKLLCDVATPSRCLLICCRKMPDDILLALYPNVYTRIAAISKP
jgi:hypothetical protein